MTDNGEVELEAEKARELLVLDAGTGRVITSGSVRWLNSEVPADLVEFRWASTQEPRQWFVPAGTRVALGASGYRTATLTVASDATRLSVPLAPVSDVEVTAEPPGEGTVLLTYVRDIAPFTPLADVVQRYDLENGHAVVPDLDSAPPLVGAILAEGYSPQVLRIDSLPAHLDLQLDRGLNVRGRVRDADDRPIANATIAVTGSLQELDGLPYTQTSATDEDGRYAVSGLLPGEVTVGACAKGWTCGTRDLTLVADAEEPPYAEMALQPGIDLLLHVMDQHGIPIRDVLLRAKGQSFETDDSGTATIPGVAVGSWLELAARGSGVIPWQGGMTVDGSPDTLRLERGASLSWPIALADEVDPERVFARWERSRPSDHQPLEEGFGHWDDARREVVVEGLRPGNVRVKVEIPGFATLISEQVEIITTEHVTLPSAVPDTGGTITGRVISAQGGAPIAGARVTCMPGTPATYQPPRSESGTREATADIDGFFSVGGLRDGRFRVRAVAPGYAPTQSDEVEVDSSVGDLELGQGISVSGVITHRTGEPVAASTRVEAWEPAPYAYDPESIALTDENARFRMTHLPVGTWKLTVASGGKSAQRMIEGGDGDELDVDIQIGGTHLSGVVIRDGDPVGPGALSLEPPGERSGPVVLLDRGPTPRFFGLANQPMTTTVSSAGHFEFSSIDPGLWIARVSLQGGTTSAGVEVNVPDTESHSCIVELPYATITGWVVDEDDQPVGGARIDLVFDGGSEIAFSDPQGAFSVPGVPTGPVQLVAAAQGYRESKQETVLVGDRGSAEPVTLVLGAPSGGSVEAHIRSAAGSLAGAPAFLVGPSGGPRYLGGNTPVRWENLQEGKYRVCARAYGGALGCTNPLEVDDEPVSVTLDLGLGGFVAATIPDSDQMHLSPAVSLTDGTDLTGLAFLGNQPQRMGETLLLGPFAAGSYVVSVAFGTGRISGLVDVKEGATTNLEP